MSGNHAAMFFFGPMYDYSSNVVLNGTFVDASEWTQTSTDWTLGGGVATCVADGSTNIRQPTKLVGVSILRLRLSYRLVSKSGPGYVYPTIESTSGAVQGVQRYAAGTFDEHLQFASISTFSQIRFNFGGGDGTGGSITDVRLYMYTPS